MPKQYEIGQTVYIKREIPNWETNRYKYDKGLVASVEAEGLRVQTQKRTYAYYVPFERIRGHNSASKSLEAKSMKSNAEIIRQVLDTARLWECTDADTYNVRADHVAQDIAAALAPGHTDLMIEPEEIDRICDQFTPADEAIIAGLEDHAADSSEQRALKALAPFGARVKHFHPDTTRIDLFTDGGRASSIDFADFQRAERAYNQLLAELQQRETNS